MFLFLHLVLPFLTGITAVILPLFSTFISFLFDSNMLFLIIKSTNSLTAPSPPLFLQTYCDTSFTSLTASLGHPENPTFFNYWNIW
jgi:hypothetical protein